MAKPAPAPETPTTPTTPTWKFWQPMPFWHALLIMICAHLVTSLMVVGMQGLGLAVPVAAAGAGGAFLGYYVIIERARKLRSGR